MPSNLLTRIFLNIVLLGAFAMAWPQGDLAAQAAAMQNAKKWPEAVELWSRVLEANPTQADNWFQRGFCRFEEKEYRQAISDFQKADELGVSYRWSMPYRIARCYALLGEKERALEWLAKAFDLGYRSLTNIVKQDDFKDLRDDPRFKRLTATEDVSKLDRNAAWRYDIQLYAQELKRRHYNPYLNLNRQQLDAYVAKLDRDVPSLTDNQILVRILMLARKMGDGHTGFHDDFNVNCLPVRFYFFKEGLYVISADPAHADLLGARVLRVGNTTPDAALKKLDEVISCDNSMTTLSRAPNFMRYMPVMNGLGLFPSDKQASLTIVDAKGTERTVTLAAMNPGKEDDWVAARKVFPGSPPPTFAHMEKYYRFEYLPEAKTVYCQYNVVIDQEGQEKLEAFFGRMFKFIEENDVQRLVIDLRWNGGGNNFLNQPLIEGLIRSKINQEGKLFVIAGRYTFSAAMCCAAQIERYSKAIFVGEPTGSKPNFVGESVGVFLPHSKLDGAISDLLWQNSVAMDYRTWIAPTLYAPPTWEAYSQGRDLAMEAIAAYVAAHKG